MRAAIFSQMGEILSVGEVPDPVPQPGDVVVDVTAAPVLAYAAEVFSGARPMLFELPFVPGTGAIGQISNIGIGATELNIGDWAYCVQPCVRATSKVPRLYLYKVLASPPSYHGHTTTVSRR